MTGVPCPICGHGDYRYRPGLSTHLWRHHATLDDRERSNAIQTWLRQGGERR